MFSLTRVLCHFLFTNTFGFDIPTKIVRQVKSTDILCACDGRSNKCLRKSANCGIGVLVAIEIS